MKQRVVVHRLGRMPYEPAWELQRRLQSELIAARRLGEAQRAHRLLLVEHPHVFTLGKSGDEANLLARAQQLEEREATFVPVDRGGDITYHGPGQLVAYPILDLERIRYPDGGRGTDVHRYLRELENVIIELCADFGLRAGRVPGRTGVWLPAHGRRPERKICAMGIRCSRWVSMHGLALNVETDLSYFDLIVPCGIADGGVTSLSRELDRPIRIDDVLPAFLQHFAARFGTALAEQPLPPTAPGASEPSLTSLTQSSPPWPSASNSSPATC